MKRINTRNYIIVVLIFVLTILNINVSFAHESSDTCDDIELSISPSDNILTENYEDCNDLISPNCETDIDDEAYAELFEDTYSGICGENANWSLDVNTGVMTISGSGDMEDYENVLSTPWYNYKSIITEVNMDSGITSLGSYAFCACYSLKNINFSNSLTSINSFALDGCDNLTDIVIPESVTNIGNAAFYDCDGLVYVIIPGNVINIGEYAFALCDNLVSVTISEGVESIGLRAFRSTALSGITIPSSVSYIGTAAFSNDNLEEIIVNDNNEYYGTDSNGILLSKDGSVLVECPCLLHKEYCEENGYDYEKTVFSLTIPDTVKTIEKDAFLECYYLSYINILGASEIGNYAFHNCYNLSSIDLPDSMESIGTGVFYNCMSLSSISIPYGITSISDCAFTYCISLANITLPSSITEIGKEAFWKCYSLESITIPEGVTTINELVFDECTYLKSIVLPKTLSVIARYAFYNCALLQTVYYCGTEEEWNNVYINYTHNEVLKSAEIIYSYENTFDSDVEITVDDVSGGVEVSLFSEGSQSIYYTTDGTIPTTKSKIYESPFTLTNVGNYTVEAVAYNGSDYGSVYNKSINIGQTTSPSISCNNGIVTITAETGADIYYNTSLTPPTIGSNLYNGSFTISESTYVSAIAVKNGYTKSNTVSMYCVGTEEKDDYQPLTDSYSFNNERKSFGYSMVYKIPESTYIAVFGETLGKVIYNENAFNEEGSLISWKGSCFGMALTSALFYTNGLTANTYCDEDYENIYAIEAPGLAEASLTKLIERCQVSQFLPVIQTEMFCEDEDGGNWVQSGYGDLSDIVSAAQNCMNEPIIIYINRLTSSDNLYGHAVLPYRVENSSESEDIYYIYIYDCDSPNTDDGENYIIVDLNSNTFSYYNGTATYDFSISYVKLSSLIENDTVSLLQDDDLENNSSIMNDNFLFVANSKDISIYNTSGVEASNISGAVKYGTIGTDETSSVMWLLPDDDYTVVNNDSSIKSFEVKVVDETDSFALTTDKVSSTVKFGRYGDRLYISSSSSGKANITVNTHNSTKKENSVSIYSNYVYVKPYNDDIIELYTNTNTIEANDIEYTLDTYSGSVVSARYMILISKNAADEVENECDISVVSKPKISDGALTGNLKLNLVNNGEISQSGTLYIALYDEDSNKILTEQSQTISSLLSNESRNAVFKIYEDLSDVSESYILKIMFWNENMQPIIDIIELTY